MGYKIIDFKGKKYIQSKKMIELGLKHCFTTADMNMMLADDEKSLSKGNFDEIFEMLKVEPKCIYSGLQVHGDNIARINDYKAGEPKYYGRFFDDTDALISNLKNTALVVKFADCTPILLYDFIQKIHVVIHSGWKGTLKRIASKALKIMFEEYNSKSANIVAVIGPAIGKYDFEVRSDVEILFRTEFSNWNDLISIKDKEKFLIDIVEINKRILLQNGILENNIEIIPLSTYSTNYLHSYRRDKKDYGLMGLVSVLD